MLWSGDAVSKLRGRLDVRGAMQSDRVTADALRLDLGLDVVEGDEPALVEALVPEHSVKALDVGVLNRLAPGDEVELDALSVGSSGHRAGRELAPVVDPVDVRLAEALG